MVLDDVQEVPDGDQGHLVDAQGVLDEGQGVREGQVIDGQEVPEGHAEGQGLHQDLLTDAPEAPVDPIDTPEVIQDHLEDEHLPDVKDLQSLELRILMTMFFKIRWRNSLGPWLTYPGQVRQQNRILWL